MSRDASLDVARGIAIVCVVLGHGDYFGAPAEMVNAIFTFHMPLFFVLSGFLASPEARPDARYVGKCARSLLLPYAVTCAITLSLYAVRTLLFWPEGLLDVLSTMGIASLYGSGTTIVPLPDGVTMIGAIWFLPALFWAKLLLAAANRSPFPLAAVLCLFVAGYASTNVLWLPLDIQAGACAALFLYLGQRIREKDVLSPGGLHPLLWAAAAGMWLTCLGLGGQADDGGKLLSKWPGRRRAWRAVWGDVRHQAVRDCLSHGAEGVRPAVLARHDNAPHLLHAPR